MAQQAPPPLPHANRSGSPPPVKNRYATQAKPAGGRKAVPQDTLVPVAEEEPAETGPFFDRLSVLATSFGVSTLAHLLVLSLMAFFVFGTSIERELFTESQLAPKKQRAPLERVKADLSSAPVKKDKRTTTKTKALPITKTGPTGSLDIDVPAPEVGTPNPGDGGGTGTGQLFGAGREAKSFVFVVDCSGSMTGKRFNLAINELVYTIKKLKQDQQFYVVFFSSGTYPLFETANGTNFGPPARSIASNSKPLSKRQRRAQRIKRQAARRRRQRRGQRTGPRNPGGLLPATTTNKTQARQWIARLRPGGGTLPEEALRIAIQMRPEVVYFLTDGIIPDETPDLIRNANQYEVRVNTIALGYDGSAQLLKQIASENNGHYRFVK